MPAMASARRGVSAAGADGAQHWRQAARFAVLVGEAMRARRRQRRKRRAMRESSLLARRFPRLPLPRCAPWRRRAPLLQRLHAAAQ